MGTERELRFDEFRDESETKKAVAAPPKNKKVDLDMLEEGPMGLPSTPSEGQRKKGNKKVYGDFIKARATRYA